MGRADRTRVIVGLDGSLASMRALHRAVREARARDAELHVVHARPSARPDHYQAAFRAGGPRPDEVLDRQAEALIDRTLEDALGGPPPDVPVERRVVVGKPRRALAHLGWRDDDLLVVGTRSRGRLSRLFRRSVSRYLVAHAQCPVLVVPPDSFVRAMQRRSRIGRSAWQRDVWKRFDAVTADDHPSAHGHGTFRES